MEREEEKLTAGECCGLYWLRLSRRCHRVSRRFRACVWEHLRDGGQHVVPVPHSTGGVRRPWPLAPDSIAMMTYGQGWVLCVPEQLVEEAKARCLDRSFADIAHGGDGQQELWFARGAKDEERPMVRNAATYGPLTQLAESLDVSAWSHYFHWYCDAALWSGSPPSGHVRLIQKEL